MHSCMSMIYLLQNSVKHNIILFCVSMFYVIYNAFFLLLLLYFKNCSSEFILFKSMKIKCHNNYIKQQLIKNQK